MPTYNPITGKGGRKISRVHWAASIAKPASSRLRERVWLTK